MQKKRLGTNGPEIPSLVLGGNVYGWTLDEPGSFRQIDRALEAGLNCIDTSDVYSRWIPGHVGGESEMVIGKWLARTGRRGEVFLATKLGIDMGEGKSGLSPRYIHEAVDASLRRLQTDYIDLYQAHTDDPATPLEETLSAFQKLIEAGKVRHIGASNYSGARLAEALETSKKNSLPAYISLQPHYNMVERAAFESDQLPVVTKYGLGVIPYFSLAAGFLSGKYRCGEESTAARAAHVKKYQTERGWAIVDTLVEIAAELNAQPSSVALAWLMAKPGVTAPIASATNDAQLDALVSATELKLDEECMKRLDEVSAPVEK